MPVVTRRWFLSHAVQATLVGAALLAGCNTPQPQSTAPRQPDPTPADAPTTGPTAAATPATPIASNPTPTRPAVTVAASPVSVTATPTSLPHLAVVRGDDPAALVRTAIGALGGIGRFVRPGQRVLVKPNICVSQPPQYAATTNPEVVAAVVTLCREAGASRVLVLDGPFAGIATAYRVSGIEDAVKAAGGTMEMMSRLKFVKTPLPLGKDLKSWPIYEDALKYDVLINVPIAKHHNLATLTLGMKNLMGLVDDRGAFHSNIGQRLADLSTVVRPALVIIDAVRILVRNGPTGGNLADVKQTNTVIASTDPVAADAYGATLFGLRGDDLAYVRAGAEMALGVKDLSQLRIAELRV